MSIKFSICIPNRNYGSYLKKTIESVLNQTFQDFEIIVADNASTDNSIDVVKSFNDNRIRLVQNRYNIGFAPNLDKATELAQGDYMLLLSSDDLMKPTALEEYSIQVGKYNGLETPLVLMSACDVVDGTGKVFSEKKAQTGDVLEWLRKSGVKLLVEKASEVEIYDGHKILKGLLLGSFQPAGQFLTTCYSSKLYRTVEGYRSIMSVLPDAHFSHKLLFENPKVVYVNKTLFSYRVHGANNLAELTKMSNIKNLIDNYLFTQIYDRTQLAQIGLDSSDLKQVFVRRHCLQPALFGLLRGNFKKAAHHYFFGIASYPRLVFMYLLGWLLPIMMLFSPLFRLFYWLYQKSKS